MEKLSIGLDPGFDSLKIIIGGTKYKFPFNAVLTDESKFIKHSVSRNLFIYRNNEMRTWRVGEYARQLVYETKDREEIQKEMESFYSKDRFTKSEFKVTLETAIIVALLKHKENHPEFRYSLDKLDDIELIPIVALPHGIADEYRGLIIDTLAGEHSFELKLGNNDYKRFSFNIKEENVGTISQTLAALISITTDDEGNEIEDYSNILAGPSLIADGGFYTMGLVEINDGDIYPGSSESNTDFAMLNVYRKVEDALKHKRNDIKSYNIEYLLKKYNGTLKYKNDSDTVETIDLRAVRDEEIKNVCKDFIAYVNKEYDYLLDTKYFILTGGTGAEYYKHLLEHYTSNNTLEEDSIILTEGTLMGEEWSPEFAISVGAYKVGRMIALNS